MIDFQQGFIKLAPIAPDRVMPLVAPMLVNGEQIVAAFKTNTFHLSVPLRDGLT